MDLVLHDRKTSSNVTERNLVHILALPFTKYSTWTDYLSELSFLIYIIKIITHTHTHTLQRFVRAERDNIDKASSNISILVFLTF